MKLFRYGLLSLLLVVFLAACGGGGGGGGSTGAAPPSGNVGLPSQDNTSEITAQSASTIAAGVVDVVAGLAQLASVSATDLFLPTSTNSTGNTGGASQLVLKLIGAHGATKQVLPAFAVVGRSRPTEPCLISGSITFSAVVQNQTTLSPGDSISADFNNCDDGDGLILNGGLDFTFVSFSQSVVNCFINSICTGQDRLTVDTDFRDFRITDAVDTVSSNGDLRLVIDTTTPPVSTVTVSGDSLTLSVGALSEALIGYSTTLTVNSSTGAFTIRSAGALQIPTLFSRSVTYATTDPFMGISSAAPGSGSLVIEGADGATINLIVLSIVDLQLDIDLDGDGIVDDTQFTTWAELSALSVELSAFAGNDQTAPERETISLLGSTSRPAVINTVTWTQTQGTAAIIADPDQLGTDLTLPSVSASETLSFELTVTDNLGNTVSDSVNVFVTAYTNTADISVPDSVFEQCLIDIGANDGLEDVGEYTYITCSGVSDITGLFLFQNVTQVSLTDNTLESLVDIFGRTNLELLDLTGNSSLFCDEIDQLAGSLDPGAIFLVDDICRGTIVLDLVGNGFDTALDTGRQRVYVSVPSRNEIVVVSLMSLRIIDRILLPGSPQGIDLSIDGTRLFAALVGSNAVAVIDLANRDVRTIALADKSGDPRTYDVLEGDQDRLFVTTNASSSGLSYVVQVRLDQNDTLSRVAGGRIIRARPVLARSPDSQFVYVGEGFSPNSLYKLSLADPDAGIVLEDDHGSVGGTDNLVLNSSGTRIALSSGQVLRTGSFLEEGRIPSGFSAATLLSDDLMLNTTAGTIAFYDFDTLQLNDSIDTRCQLSGTARRLHSYNADQDFVLMRDSQICVAADVSRSTPADPYPELRFADLALENCVLAAAQTQGLSVPEDFVQLDCSNSSLSIRSLAGLEAMINLEQLDISNSDVFDLAPLAGVSTLQILTARNAAIGDVGPLFSLPALNSLDVIGNPNINCVQLDSLATGGVSVQADFCAEQFNIELGGIGFDLELDSANDRAFVSVPSLQAILEIDLTTFSIAQTWDTSEQPRGIDLSADGATLYAALNNLGSVAYIDTTSGVEQLVNLSVLLDDDRTFDVAEVSQDRIVVSSAPGSNGFAYIVEVRRDQGNAAQRVASQRIIRASPVFAVSNDGSSVYVGEGFSPNSLYKLDANQAIMPIIVEDAHGSVSGTSHLSLNPDGSRIFTAAGQVLNTDTLIRVGQLAPGVSIVSADNSIVYVADGDPDAVGIYDAQNLNKIGQRDLGCSLQSVSRLAELSSGGILAMGVDLLCGSQTVPY